MVRLRGTRVIVPHSSRASRSSLSRRVSAECRRTGRLSKTAVQITPRGSRYSAESSTTNGMPQGKGRGISFLGDGLRLLHHHRTQRGAVAAGEAVVVAEAVGVGVVAGGAVDAPVVRLALNSRARTVVQRSRATTRVTVQYAHDASELNIKHWTHLNTHCLHTRRSALSIQSETSASDTAQMYMGVHSMRDPYTCLSRSAFCVCTFFPRPALNSDYNDT
jgi:hypothetical protein